MCWGSNSNSELGRGPTQSDASYADPAPVQGLASFATFAVGPTHACVTRASGQGATAQCWGANASGQLGNGEVQNASLPVDVVTSDIITFSRIFCGGNHTCALLSGGKLRCWGQNDEGQLGIGSRDSKSIPHLVNNPDAEPNAIWVLLATGGVNTCGITNSDNVYCWGAARYGANGNGNESNVLMAPGPSIATLAGPVGIVGIGATFYVWTSSGSYTAWGNNSNGLCGQNTTTTQATPVTKATANVKHVISTLESGCTLHFDGSLKCFGANEVGQVGIGTQTSTVSPTVVPPEGGNTWAAGSGGMFSVYAYQTTAG